MSEKKQVIFISDQFGYRCGGSNTFNIELCFALRQIAAEDVDLFSLVINCQENDRIARLEQGGGIKYKDRPSKYIRQGKGSIGQ